MQFVSHGVLTDYDPDEGMYHVTDTAHPAIAGATPNVGRVYDLAKALMAPGPADDDGPWYDSGDAQPDEA